VNPTVFLDTGFAIALLSPRDRYHEVAARLGVTLKSDRIRILTTDAVLLEIGSALSRIQHRQAAALLIAGLQGDPAVEILPVDDDLFDAGFELFRQHDDKEWSLTDCISFSVMRNRTVTEVLGADIHFRQAGFTPLLLEP
jgi:hypothetical protein